MKNLQGDIVAILDSNGTAVVQYKYDAWGRPISCTYSDAHEHSESLGKLNPFRYRGYVYDEETGLYYLRSRYYAPFCGRFINEDAIYTRNAYVYCANSPLILTDDSGYAPTSSQFSMCAIDVGTPDYTDPIITKLEESMNSFSSHSVVLETPGRVASVMPEYAIVDVLSATPFITANYLWFAKQVALNGPWDLKNTWSKTFPYLSEPTNSNQVIFLGELVTSEDIGNFAYGFNGSAMGASPIILYIGAGAAQYAFAYNDFAGWNLEGISELASGAMVAIQNENGYWGDTQRDYEWVTKGIEYYQTHYGR